MRAFRISFDERESKFVLEIQGFAGLYWKRARQGDGKTAHHDTYQAAKDHVEGIGLNLIYRDFTHGSDWSKATSPGQVPPKAPGQVTTKVPPPPPPRLADVY